MADFNKPPMQTQFQIETPEGMIRAELHTPSGRRPLGTVQIIHGYFSSHRVGPNRLYVELARRLCMAGFLVVRADAIGVGESDGDFAECSFASAYRDALIVHRFIVASQPGLQHAVIGHSMGANVALRMASEEHTVALVSPISPVFMHHGGIAGLFSPEQILQITREGNTVRKGLVVQRAIIDEWELNDAIDLARRVHVPVIVFQGQSDQFYDFAGAQRLAEVTALGRCLLVPMADHNFLVESARRMLYDIVTKELLAHFDHSDQ